MIRIPGVDVFGKDCLWKQKITTGLCFLCSFRHNFLRNHNNLWLTNLTLRPRGSLVNLKNSCYFYITTMHFMFIVQFHCIKIREHIILNDLKGGTFEIIRRHP
jgi:hypothetical protein